MTRLPSTALGLALLALLGGSHCFSAADAPPSDDHLAPVARFIGDWQVDAKWADGTPLKARATYTWGLNKKIVVGKTFVQDPTKGEYQRYEGILAWNPKKKSLYEISFAYDGSISEVLIDTVDKDTLHFGYRPFDEGGPANVRQTIHFASDDAFVWTVSVKSGETWSQIIEATWRRKPK
jgi:hypothetical protein